MCQTVSVADLQSSICSNSLGGTARVTAVSGPAKMKIQHPDPRTAALSSYVSDQWLVTARSNDPTWLIQWFTVYFRKMLERCRALTYMLLFLHLCAHASSLSEDSALKYQGAAAIRRESSNKGAHVMFVSWLGRSHMIPYLEILQELKLEGFRVGLPYLSSIAAKLWLDISAVLI
jgi:hypothetical protein